MGVNPRGLKPNALWQMDVTHVNSFGKLSFVHVTLDTYSHALFASARTGEAFKDVQQHLFQCFSVLGMPFKIKTDNGPAYTSKSFKNLCEQFHIEHSTGIPYNPQGQAIIERTNQILKNQIVRLQNSDLKYASPHQILAHCMLVLNHLTPDNSGETPMLKHWENKLTIKPLVKWKDVLSGTWKGPDVLLTAGRGFACIFPQESDSPIWVPDRLVRNASTSSSSNLSQELEQGKGEN